MRLLKLSANKSSFRTVEFRPNGLSLVVAEQTQGSVSPTATYNGVGKSLVFAIIHYCLGSNKNDAFQRHLKDWVFSLTVEIDGRSRVISRSADKPNEIILDGEEIALSKLREILGEACFGLGVKTKRLSFRSLISRFIRVGRAAYNDFSYANEGEQKKPYEAMLRSAYLLGLDLKLARTKYELRSREQKLKDTMKQLEQEPLFAELLAEDTVDIEIAALRDEATRLRDDLKSFRVAEDYHDIELEANRIKRELDGARRNVVKLDEAIRQIDRSLETKGDIPPEMVFAMYEEAESALPESVKRRAEEVVLFQRELQQKRIYRLTQERQRLEQQRSESQRQVQEASKRMDDKLRYLSEHRALDEYLAVNNELSEVNQRITRLEESKNLRDKIDRELKTISRDLAEENIRTDTYLDSASDLINEATSVFRSFSADLYGSRKSGLTIANDSGNNQQRYKIEARITADAAEGINEAKIFCFDMTILKLGRGHDVRFITHDSTLFGPIDPRQRLAMFRIANRVCEELGAQYIVALNLHDITSIRGQVEAEEEELEQLFGEDAVVLRLTDESPAKKLLGFDVDMDYTK